MMSCPHCTEPAGCKETRVAANFPHKWIKGFAANNPGVAVRRRVCPVHGAFLTLEVAVSVLQVLMAPVKEEPCSTT